MSGGMSPKATKLTFRSCTGSLPKDLRRFTELRELVIVDTIIDGWPLLSNTVEKIHFENNRLSEIGEFPPYLKELTICNNYILNLPELPKTVTNVIFNLNHLKTLQSQFHEGLTHLDLRFNMIKTLPDVLPSSLIVLHLIGNLIERLPASGPNLRILNFASNRVHDLPPNFAESYPEIEELNCLQNPISHIQSLSNKLTVLRIEYTRLRKTTYRFPPVPDTLQYVCCDIPWMLELAKIRNINPMVGISLIPGIPGELIRQIDRFRELYYAVKLQPRFNRWLWRSREMKIRDAFSPEKLTEFLEAEEKRYATEFILETAIEQFINMDRVGAKNGQSRSEEWTIPERRMSGGIV